MDIRRYGHKDVHTDAQRGGGTHFTCQDITCHMSVQINVVQPSSIVQFNTAVGWFTKNTKKLFLKNQAVES